jgi:N5-(cytidine 5'-diphosphoramidyl)-L-glutamine hydrolase
MSISDVVRSEVAEFSDLVFLEAVLQCLCSLRPKGMIFDPSPPIIVGITQRIDSVAGRDELRDTLDQRLSQWLVYAGFLPIVIPNTFSNSIHLSDPTLENWLEALKPVALILSGGNDIGEYQERDTTECYLLSWAEEKQIPVLGICRGLQMMAVWAGASLVKLEGHVGSRHQLVVSGQKDNWPANVNSYHNWVLASCPDGFEIAAQAEDGSIEAIKHIKLPWEAWMWHPERELPFFPQDINRLKRLFRGQ